MDRREMMQSGVTLALATAGTSAMAQTGSAEHNHHHHHGGGASYSSLAGAAAGCTSAGQACLAHCVALLGQGDKDMAACAAKVSQMLATCEAMMKLAASDSKYVPKMAALTLAACKECGAECSMHAAKHQACKDCADACAVCGAECKKVSA